MLDYRSVFPGAVSKICPNLWPSKNCPGNSTIKFCPGGQNGTRKLHFERNPGLLHHSWWRYINDFEIEQHKNGRVFPSPFINIWPISKWREQDWGPIINPSPNPPEQRKQNLWLTWTMKSWLVHGDPLILPHTIHVCYIYLHLADVYGFHVGEYTIHGC